MSETTLFWIEAFEAEGKDAKEEIEEVRCAISNERLWEKGSRSKEEAERHAQNIIELQEYLEWLEERRTA